MGLLHFSVENVHVGSLIIGAAGRLPQFAMRSYTMSLSTPNVNSWEQLTLVRPAVVTLSLLVGIYAESDHVQAQLEVRNATSGELIALQSWPSFSCHDVDTRMREVGREFTRLLSEALSPFPDA